MFSYGKIDLSYVLQMDFPFNNLTRIAEELNGYIKHYKDVLFIGHSQGGLLAKTYATLYYKKQGIHLLTLHTPHLNKSISVLRFSKPSFWESEVMYAVPHIFCASINDNKIVKPQNALATCRDKSYISTNERYKKLGHSHLCRKPDDELIKLYSNEIFTFINSGASLQEQIIRDLEPKITSRSYHIVYSKDESNNSKSPEKDPKILNPWVNLVAINKKEHNHEIEHYPTTIFHNGCSINFFYKYLINTNNEGCRIKITLLDKDDDNNPDSISNALCRDFLTEGDNPYINVPFDIYDYRRGSLFEYDEFKNCFIKTISDGAERGRNKEIYENPEYTYNAYNATSEHLRRMWSDRICTTLNYFSLVSQIDLNSTISYLTVFLLKKKLYKHQEIYRHFNKPANPCHKLGLNEFEIVLSYICHSDGIYYWIDPYISQLFESTIRDKYKRKSLHIQSKRKRKRTPLWNPQ